MNRKQCHVTKRQGKLQPCKALGMALADGGKGVRYRQLYQLNNKCREGASFCTLHSGEFTKRGVVMNFCPFCSRDISSHLGKDRKK